MEIYSQYVNWFVFSVSAAELALAIAKFALAIAKLALAIAK